MADDKTVEGNTSAPAGEADKSNPPASGEGSQPLAGDQGSLATRLDALEQLVKETLKNVQKGTDKQIAHRVDASIARISELVKEGKSEEQIKRELWIDQQLEAGSGGAQPALDKGGTDKTPDLSAVIDEVLNLPVNDSRVTDLKLKHGNDIAAYLRSGLELVAKLAAHNESTPGEHPLPGGEGVKQPENPIANIDDPRTLYKMAAQQIAGQTKKRGTR